MKVAVVGCIGIDTNVYFYGGGPDFEREATFTQNIDYIGQAGGYTTRLLHCMGHEPILIAPVGDDYHGEHIRKTFHQQRICDQGLFTDPMGTNRSINFMYANGSRKNFYDGKGNYDLPFSVDQFMPMLNGSAGAHFHIPNWSRKLLKPCVELGIPISVDLQDIVDLDDQYRHDYLYHAAIVFFSLANFEGSELAVMQTFAERFPNKVFVAGNGAKGCWSVNRGEIEFHPALKSGAEVIDTNGAGDSLACGVLHGLWHLRSNLQQACLIGQKLARYVCTIKASTNFSVHDVQSCLVSHHPHR